MATVHASLNHGKDDWWLLLIVCHVYALTCNFNNEQIALWDLIKENQLSHTTIFSLWGNGFPRLLYCFLIHSWLTIQIISNNMCGSEIIWYLYQINRAWNTCSKSEYKNRVKCYTPLVICYSFACVQAATISFL